MNLSVSTNYTATLATEIEDVAGNTLAGAKVWSFSTGTSIDTTPPAVSSTSPSDGEQGAPQNIVVSATFSEDMDPFTITNSTFILSESSGAVAGQVSNNVTEKKAFFNPEDVLDASTSYSALITAGVRDISCNNLASEKSWFFTTAAQSIITFIAVGGAGSTGDKGSVWLSANGAPGNWTGYDLGEKHLYDIAYGNGRIVAVGVNGESWWSTSGAEGSWNDSTPGSLFLYGVLFGEGKFVSVGDDGQVWWSSDGTPESWTYAYTGGYQLFGIGYGEDRFIAADRYGKLWWSSDAVQDSWAACGVGGAYEI